MPRRVGINLGGQFVGLDRQVWLMFGAIAEAIRVATAKLTSAPADAGGTAPGAGGTAPGAGGTAPGAGGLDQAAGGLADDGPAGGASEGGPGAGGLHRLVDQVIEEQFARYPPMGSEFRYLVTLLRVVPELERSAELVELIAERAYLQASLPVAAVDCVAEMGRTATAMWEAAGEAWASVDPEAEARLDVSDDRMDELTSALPAMLAREGIAARAAIELTLVARFYERLGDHAVHIAGRIRWLAEGD